MFVAVYSVRSGTVTGIVMMALGSYICHEAGPAVGHGARFAWAALAWWQGTAALCAFYPAILPDCPPVVRMMMLCAILLIQLSKPNTRLTFIDYVTCRHCSVL